MLHDMRELRIPIALFVLFSFWPAIPVGALQSAVRPEIGSQFLVVMETETRGTADGSRSSSSSRQTLTERIIERSQDGILVEYDFHSDATDEERARVWQLPVHVFIDSAGTVSIQNLSELESRVDPWLEHWDFDRSMCGRWLFTWTAFQIDCDPESAVGYVQPLIVHQYQLFDGSLVAEHGTLEPAHLDSRQRDSGGLSYTAQFDIDPDVIRRERAMADVIIAEIYGRPPLDIEDSMEERRDEQISGQLSLTIETDTLGDILRIERLSETEIRLPDGANENQWRSQVVTRQPLASGTD
ncbi:hypothetical protein [Hyphobacterium sp.]|uniref:hypothetical protein n=1 Tax=Hyphobacterium sp. TaxID=2004662 RepID=UPI0037480C18